MYEIEIEHKESRGPLKVCVERYLDGHGWYVSVKQGNRLLLAHHRLVSNEPTRAMAEALYVVFAYLTPDTDRCHEGVAEVARLCEWETRSCGMRGSTHEAT